MSKQLLNKYTLKFEGNDLYENIRIYYERFGRSDVYNHTLEVVEQTRKLSIHHSFDIKACELGAYLHDIGRVVDYEDIVQLCFESGHEIIDGEGDVPSILHQIASRIIASSVFGIQDERILSAVECHTTLKKNPSEVDMVVFLSDKLSWQDEEYMELVAELNEKSKVSKEKAIAHYLESLHAKRRELKCYHKWSEEAYLYFHTLNDCYVD